ncbi:MAG: hypothetical protein JOY66_13715, partial [Acetobacteraceae bacterium]|nr:hypothetical protein [Acetobacteraceae bacterium]
IDTAHFSFLHMSLGESDAATKTYMAQSEAAADTNRVRWMRGDSIPKFWINRHDAGLVIGAARRADGSDLYWRIAQFLMPNHATTPSACAGETYHGQTWVPIDDRSCWIYCWSWNPDRPLTEAERAKFSAGHTIHGEVDARGVPLRTRANDYLIDRVDQKFRSFTGIKGVSEQDSAIQDSQGLIADRSREHLGPTDLGIVRFRRLMLEAARDLAAGVAPGAAADPDAYKVRSGGAVAAGDKSLAEVMTERFGDPHGRV